MKTLLAAVVLFNIASTANAALVGSTNGKTVYDTDLNITWLADTNYAKTSGYDVDGKMTWSQAQSWIASLNASNYLGYSDWRLPTTTDTFSPGCNYAKNGSDCGYNSAGSEMSHLYYNEFGNKGYYAPSGAYQPGYGLVNDPTNPNDESLFTNLQNYGAYWSGTEYSPDTNYAWYFYQSEGMQNYSIKSYNMYALIVRDGQVAALPVPAAAWLLGSGLLGLIGVARRKAA